MHALWWVLTRHTKLFTYTSCLLPHLSTSLFPRPPIPGFSSTVLLRYLTYWQSMHHWTWVYIHSNFRSLILLHKVDHQIDPLIYYFAGRILPCHYPSGPLLNGVIVYCPSISGLHTKWTHMGIKLRIPSPLSAGHKWSPMKPYTHMGWGRGANATTVNEMVYVLQTHVACLCTLVLITLDSRCTTFI